MMKFANKEKLLKLWDLVKRYKHSIVIFWGFLFIIMPSDDMGNRWRNNQKDKKLRKEISYYQQKIEDCKTKSNLSDNKEELEKYAREVFFMHRNNEDIFIIDEE